MGPCSPVCSPGQRVDWSRRVSENTAQDRTALTAMALQPLPLRAGSLAPQSPPQDPCKVRAEDRDKGLPFSEAGAT